MTNIQLSGIIGTTVNDPFTLGFVDVTPELAEQLLAQNITNRNVRLSNLKLIVTDIEDGEFQLTHQGIAINSLGQLVDGQHRLLAIIKTGKTLRMALFRYNSPVTPLGLNIDRSAKRTASDIHQLDRKVAETAATLAVIMKSGNTPTVHETKQTYDLFSPMIFKILEACKTTRKYRSSSSTRAGIVAAMVNAPPETWDEICLQYRLFVNMDLEKGMKLSVLKLLKYFDAGNVDYDKKIMTTKAYFAFNPENFDRTSFRSSSMDAVYLDVKATLLKFAAEDKEKSVAAA